MHPTPSKNADVSQAPATAAANMSRTEIAVCLGLSLAVFFLYQGPFWRHRWQIDGSIWYSYLVIPFVVAMVLLRGRKLAFRPFALGTIEVTCWKFGATYLFAHTLWMFSPPPSRPAVTIVPLPDAPPAALRRPVALDQTGSLDGSVTDRAGGSVEGVVVFIEGGLEAYDLPRAPTGPAFSVGGGTIAPRLLVGELDEELRARSNDGKLHTLIASQGDSDLFNLPLQSSGAVSAAPIRRGLGVTSVRCAVHERSNETARLVVVSHPFHATLDQAGRFNWSAIPRGRVAIAAVGLDGRTARVELSITARESARLELPAEPDRPSAPSARDRPAP
jgi:hypothetical protein